MGSVSGFGRCPGEGHGNSLQYSCLKNPMEGGPWQAIVRGVTEFDMTEANEHSMASRDKTFYQKRMTQLLANKYFALL